MKTKTPQNTPASVRSRLLNLARTTGRTFEELTIRYTVERFLARLEKSTHQDRFILKGAMLYTLWELNSNRTTMDLDLLGSGSSDIEDMRRVAQGICETKIEDDGLIFNKESVSVTRIREDSAYHGVRIVIRVALGTMQIRLQVDVGFGDQIVPSPQWAEFPALLAERGPVIRTYSPETVISEKFNATIVLGMANSRMKDYFDIWMLSQHFTIKASVLREAIKQTFSKRHTELPRSEPIALSKNFFNNTSKQRQWKGFLRKQGRLESVPSLPEIIEILCEFLLPIVTEINTNSQIVETWEPEQGWI